jgi:lysophospholipid acyltransferase (LPLAT)-like uncharacterized protein
MKNNFDLAATWRTIQGEILYQYHYLAMRTARWRVEGKANITLARANGRPLLFAFWHGQTALFIMYGHRFFDATNFTMIAVGDERHDILGHLGSRIGAQSYAVDMAGNPVASGRAILRVIKAMKRGRDSFIAPDGPDGPVYEPKPGVVFLAKKAEANVIPVGLWSQQAIQRRRWDSYLFPYPLARVATVFGPPILANKEDDSDTLMSQITEALHAVRTRAQELAGITPWR